MLHTISSQTKFQFKFSLESDMGGVQESTLDKLARLNDEIAANRFQATLKAEGLPSDMKVWQYNDLTAQKRRLKEKGLTSN